MTIASTALDDVFDGAAAVLGSEPQRYRIRR